MSKITISDPRIRLQPNKQLLKLIDDYKHTILEMPENIANVLKAQGYDVPAKVEILTTKGIEIRRNEIDVKLLKEIINNVPETLAKQPDTNSKSNAKREVNTESSKNTVKTFLYLEDICWINNFLKQLRRDQICNVFLHEMIQNCNLILPENEIEPRNPELEARCVKLRAEQENLYYQKMTKNVDPTRQKYPEDTIAYQIKAINRQLVAVFQFVFSIAAGFVFGCWGLHWILGNLPFGFRLLLGIICALIIALAEMYFLAKKLNEYDHVVDSLNPKNRAQDAKDKKVQ